MTWQWKPDQTKISYHLHRHYHGRRSRYHILVLLGIIFAVIIAIYAVATVL